ncbi:MAG: DUF2905 domain-containing protein [Planctomycetota bacterium]
MFHGIGKCLILAGIFLILAGILFVFWQKIPFLSRLPGDIVIRKKDFSFFFPLTTCIIISLILTILINFILRILGK